MRYYIVVYLLSIISVILTNKRRLNRAIYICLLFPTLLLGLRANIGIDDAMHANAYDQFMSLGYTWRSELEVLFHLLLIICKKVGLDIQFIYFTYALLTNIFLGLTYNYVVKNRTKITMLIFIQLYYLFFFFDSMTIMRQMLSVTMMSYLLVTIESRKRRGKIFSILLILLATVFVHKISFVCLGWYVLICFFSKKTHRRNHTVLMFFGVYTLCLLDYSNIIQNVLYRLTNIFGSRFFAVFDSKYLQASHVFKNGNTGITFFVCSLIFICLAKKKRTINDRVYITGKLYIFSKLILDSFGWISRICLYLSPSYYIELAGIINDYVIVAKKEDKIDEYYIRLFSFVLLFFVLFMILLFNFSMNSQYYNYKFG